MQKQEIIKGIREKGLFDFVSNSGYLLDNEELIFLVKEFNFAVYDLSTTVCSKAEEILIEEINQNLY